jgi:hypothetical protein
MCQDVVDSNDLDRLRDGLKTTTQSYTEMQNDDKNSYLKRKTDNVALDLGLQESWEWYDKCRYRERNMNLFVADQGLRNNNKGYSSAAFTRQNPNGERNGYEYGIISFFVFYVKLKSKPFFFFKGVQKNGITVNL